MQFSKRISSLMEYFFQCLVSFPAFGGTKNHKHPEYKRIKQLKKSFEKQKMETHGKNLEKTKNKENLEKTHRESW